METITNKVDILLISETKIDSSFHLNQFYIVLQLHIGLTEIKKLEVFCSI